MDEPVLNTAVGVLMLTPRCDMACAFCGADSTFSDLKPQQAESILQLLTQQGISNLVLGGGEPLCWPGDLWQMAKLAKKMGFFVQVGSNATALPRDFSSRSQVDRWVLPLESSDQGVHNAMRPFKTNHHQKILKVLQACLRDKKSVTVSTMVSRENIQGLPALALWLQAYQQQGGQLHAWHLYRFQPEGRGGQTHAGRFDLSLTDYRQSCLRLRVDHSSLNILLRPDLYHSKNVAFFYNEKGLFMRRDKQGCRPVLCHLPLLGFGEPRLGLGSHLKSCPNLC